VKVLVLHFTEKDILKVKTKVILLLRHHAIKVYGSGGIAAPFWSLELDGASGQLQVPAILPSAKWSLERIQQDYSGPIPGPDDFVYWNISAVAGNQTRQCSHQRISVAAHKMMNVVTELKRGTP
jgi:hypothetical protein